VAWRLPRIRQQFGELESVNGSSGDGNLITLASEIRLVLKDNLDPFHDTLDIGLAEDPASENNS
jgi:hypothetical protein